MNELGIRDIQLPDGFLWWPPGPGWWWLAGLLLIALFIFPWLRRRLKRKTIRAGALAEINRIRDLVKQGQSERMASRELAALMRRILISYHGREGNAGATGDRWIAQLEKISPLPEAQARQLQRLGQARYKRDFDADMDALLQACETWVQSLPRSYAHVPD